MVERMREWIWGRRVRLYREFDAAFTLALLVFMGRACYIHDRPPMREGGA